MIKVLMVCAGNICRSPMAEAVFADLVDQAGLSDKITVDSAGTGSWHVGESADRRTLAVLRQHKIPYNGRARQLTLSDVEQFDYILAMDTENLSGVEYYVKRQREAANTNLSQQDRKLPEVNLFLHYANVAGTRTEREVPDPYYNNKFDLVYDLVLAGSKALLDHIRKTHNL